MESLSLSLPVPLDAPHPHPHAPTRFLQRLEESRFLAARAARVAAAAAGEDWGTLDTSGPPAATADPAATPQHEPLLS